MSLPLVSIIINNYNYGRYINQAIDSALDQTYVNTEVIVVDDGSDDDSTDVIGHYGDRIIPVIKQNGGQASALNAGVAVCKGSIICLLDADDIYVPEKVAETVKAFAADEQIGWFFHRSTPYKSDVLLAGDLSSIFQEVSKRNAAIETRSIDFRRNLENAELPNFAPATSNISLSRNLVDKIFPMPEVRGKSGVAISDLYLKLLAIGLETGRQTERYLCLFRQHNNIYSGTEAASKTKITTEISIATAFWMNVRHESFRKMSDKLFSRGLSLSWRYKVKDEDCQMMIQKYLAELTYVRRLKVRLMTFYYLLKLKFATAK